MTNDAYTVVSEYIVGWLTDDHVADGTKVANTFNLNEVWNGWLSDIPQPANNRFALVINNDNYGRHLAAVIEIDNVVVRFIQAPIAESSHVIISDIVPFALMYKSINDPLSDCVRKFNGLFLDKSNDVYKSFNKCLLSIVEQYM